MLHSCLSACLPVCFLRKWQSVQVPGINCVSIRYTSSYTHTHTHRQAAFLHSLCVCNYVPAQTRSVCQCFRQAGRQAGRQRISCIPPRIAHTPRCQLLLCFIASSFFFCSLAFCLVSLRPQSSAQMLTTSIASATVAHLILAIGLATGSLLSPSPPLFLHHSATAQFFLFGAAANENLFRLVYFP